MFMVKQTDWTPNLKKNNILLKYINTFYEYIWISYLTVILTPSSYRCIQCTFWQYQSELSIIYVKKHSILVLKFKLNTMSVQVFISNSWMLIWYYTTLFVIKHFCIVVIRRRSGCTLFVPKTHTPFYIEYYLYASFEDLLLARISFCCGINYETTLSYSS